MHLIVISCLVAAVTAHALDVDWGASKSFEDDPRISVNRELQNEASSRIVNGNEAKPKHFPYQAGLALHRNTGDYWCGGSIISNRWVLTAAHCTYGIVEGVDVYLGAWNRNDSTEANQLRIFVSRENVILHEHHNKSLNDLSLIKLPVVIQFNDYIQPVKLPKKSSTYPTYVGQWAIASGWGRHGREEEHNPYILRWAQFPVITNEECLMYFPDMNMLSNNRICTRSTNFLVPSTCYGDSGGPLVLADGSRTLIGVSSFVGPGGSCENGYPNGFVRITSYLDWIAEKTSIANN